MTSSENDAVEDARAALNEEGFFNREQARIVSALIAEHERVTAERDEFAVRLRESDSANDELIDQIDRLSTPPTDDEREALITLIEPRFDEAVDWNGGSRDDEGLADAILAVGFRRQRLITDNDYHEGLEEGDMYNEGFKDALRGALEIVENNYKIDAITELVIALGEED